MDESIRNAAAMQIGKHRGLLRSARRGKVLSAIMLPLLRISPAAGFGVLTTTGRKTGKARSKCVRAIRRAERVYLVALRPPHVAVETPGAVHAWVWNIRSDPRVRLRMSGGTFDGFAREITDCAERERARRAICDTVNPLDYAECALHLRGLPTRAKVQELHRYWFSTGIPVAVDLKETPA